jgi:hypothetical protein
MPTEEGGSDQGGAGNDMAAPWPELRISGLPESEASASAPLTDHGRGSDAEGALTAVLRAGARAAAASWLHLSALVRPGPSRSHQPLRYC